MEKLYDIETKLLKQDKDGIAKAKDLKRDSSLYIFFWKPSSCHTVLIKNLPSRTTPLLPPPHLTMPLNSGYIN